MFVLSDRNVYLRRRLAKSFDVVRVVSDKLLYVLLDGERTGEGRKVLDTPVSHVNTSCTWTISARFVHFLNMK